MTFAFPKFDDRWRCVSRSNEDRDVRANFLRLMANAIESI